MQKATDAMKTNLGSDTRLEKQTWKATHAKERNLGGDTRQKLIQTATHAMKTKLNATHAMETNL